LLLLATVPLASSAWFNEWRTVASLRKLDEHPLYVMRYYGDYDLQRFLQTDLPAVHSWQPSHPQVVTGWACTCFASLGRAAGAVFGRNFDWYDHAALLLFTDPPGRHASVAMVDISYLGFGRQDPSLAERRRLLHAPFLPFDGMNECGLAVGMMAVPDADPGHDPHKPSVSDLGAIRLMLDYAQNVDQALALLSGYNIAFSQPFLHYLLADVGGDSAVVEFVDGEMRILRNEEPWQVATNFVISESMPEGGSSTCWRYNAAYQVLQQARGTVTDDEAMSLLQAVSQGNTIWSIVYGLHSRDVTVAMGRQYDQVRRFTLQP
jgi:hypothetical protein